MAEAISDYQDTGGSDVNSGRRPLGSFLIAAGFLTEANLAEALHEGSESGERLGEVVVRRGWASEDDVAKLLAEQWQLGYVERASIYFDSDALSRMTREQAQRLEALPTRMQNGQVVVAVAEPTEERLAALREVIGDDTVVVVVPKTALDAGLRSDLLSGPASRAESASDEEAMQAPPQPVAPLPTPSREPERAAVIMPLPTRPSRPAEPARAVHDSELDDLLTALRGAAAEAAALSASMGELTARLSELVQQATAAAASLSETAGAREDEEKIERLEQQLSQRTELTESLKQQLAGLTRTLEDL